MRDAVIFHGRERYAEEPVLTLRDGSAGSCNRHDTKDISVTPLLLLLLLHFGRTGSLLARQLVPFLHTDLCGQTAGRGITQGATLMTIIKLQAYST